MKRKLISLALLFSMLVSIVAVLPISSVAADDATTLAGTDVTLTDGVLLNFYIEADESLGIDNAPLVNGYYVVTKELAAKEMGDDVTVELKSGDTVVAEHTYSVKEYADGILDGDYDEETKTLVEAMLSYGAAAQKYFDYNESELVGTPVADNTALKAASVKAASVDGEGYIGASLVLEGKMRLRFYFEGNLASVTVDGEEVAVVNKTDYCYVEIKVMPDSFDKIYEVKSSGATVKYSVLNYLKNNADGELSEIVSSIYAYGEAAKQYVLVENCTHENAEFEELQKATFFTEGKRVGYCENCEKIVTLTEDMTEAEVKKYTVHSGSEDDYYRLNIKNDVLKGDHFYPTEDAPEGKSLFVEFSILWNETLVNAYKNATLQSAKGYLLLGSIEDESAKKTDRPFWMALSDNNAGLWCKYAGGFEPDSVDKIYELLYGPSPSASGGEDDFVNIGDFGWHRIGIEYRQTHIWNSVGDAVYTVYADLYIDGVLVSSYDYILTDSTYYLYTVKKVNGEDVYKDISDNKYISVYRLETPETVSGTAYLPIADVYVTVGNDFVLDVEPVGATYYNPTFAADSNVMLDATAHYKLEGSEDPKPGCSHNSIYYTVTKTATMYNEGEKTGYCDNCGEDITVAVKKTVPTVERYDSNSAKDLYRYNIYSEVLSGDHFYPTESDPDGKSLLVEFSFLWNETLYNSYKNAQKLKGTVYFGSITDRESNNSASNNPLWFALSDGVSRLWCQHAGGFEPDDFIEILAGPPMNAGGLPKDKYPNIGEYGWHRIGIEYHQTASISDGEVEYETVVTLYVDGRIISQFKYELKEDNRLFNASIVDGKLVYSDCSPDTYVDVYRFDDAGTNGSVAYMPIADVYVSAGDDFLMSVAPVEDPEDATFSPASGVELDARLFFEAGVYENPDIGATPDGGEDFEDEVYEPLEPYAYSFTESYLPEDVSEALFDAFEAKSDVFSVMTMTNMPYSYTDVFTISNCRIKSITIPVARTKSANANGEFVFTLMKFKNSADGLTDSDPIKTYRIRVNAQEYGLTPSKQTVNKVITVDLSEYYIELGADETLAFGYSSDTLIPAIMQLEGNKDDPTVALINEKIPEALGVLRYIGNTETLQYGRNALCFDFVMERGFDTEAEMTAYLNGEREAEEEFNRAVEELKKLYEGKNVSVIGDSISTYEGISSNPEHNLTLKDNTVRGTYYPAYDVTMDSYTKTYWGALISKLGMTHCVTNAMSGALATGSGKKDALPERATELHRDNGTSTRSDDIDPDVIIIYNGINDASSKRSVGSLYSSLVSSNSKSDYEKVDAWFSGVLANFQANGGVVADNASFSSFDEAYALSLYLMKEKYQDAEIYCVTLLYNHNPDLTADRTNSYNRVIKALAEYFGATVVDQNGELSEMTRENLHSHASLIDSECIHPKATGHVALSRLIVKTMAQKHGIAYND